jgi:hypothetical protein
LLLWFASTKLLAKILGEGFVGCRFLERHGLTVE